MDVQEIQAVVLNILAFVLLLVTLQPSLDEATFPLQVASPTIYRLIYLVLHGMKYGEAWRAFRKQNFGICSTTYYLTVPITCTQTQIHRTQSLHYDKSLKCSSLRHIVTANFAATIYRGDMLFCFARYRCNEVSLEWYLSEILRRLYRYLADLLF